MYSSMKCIIFVVLAVLVQASPFAQQEYEFDNNMDMSSLRGGNYNMEEYDAQHGQRQLMSMGSWSWSNLLFHIGVCHAHANCTARPHHGPCGCPDCNKPHPPHFQNSYCENLSSAAAVEEDEEGVDEDRTTDENGNNIAGQTGSSRFGWLMIVAAAAAVCAVVSAAVMRKRNVETEENAREISAEAAEGGDYKLMGGMSAAIAGVMMKMGLRPTSTNSESGSVGSGNTGIVSKRLSLLQNGADVTPMAAPAPKPSFIEIQNDLDYSHEMMECDESVEVEGPYRPSSQYAL